MPKKGHFDGDKQRGSHTTVIPAASDLVKAAVRLPEVDGISAGFITTGIHAKHGRINFKKIRAGLEVTVIGNTSKQVVRIYTRSPDLVIRLLESKT